MKLLLGLLLSFIIISCSSTPLPSRETPVGIPEDFFGMCHVDSEEEFEFIDQLGVKWVLNTFYWNTIEREQGTFDFSSYDTFVDRAVRKGKKVVAVLAYDAAWLYPNGKRQRKVTPENLPHYLHFVETVVNRYKDTVDAWSIWNEPNIIFWKGTRADFYELTRVTAIKIREIHPEATVLGGVFWRAPKGFIKAMHKTGAMDNLDGVAFHPYAINPAGSTKVFDKFLKILSDLNYSKPVWITEVGFPTDGWPVINAPMEELPAYVVKTITGLAARGPRVLLWYELSDGYNEGVIPKELSLTKTTEQTYGLVYPNFQRKNGAWAYELCARYLSGSGYKPEYPERKNIPSHIISFCFLGGESGHNSLIIWNDKKQPLQIKFSLSSPAMLHDISNGKEYILPMGTNLDIGKTPLFITWQGDAVPHLSPVK